MSQKQEGDQDKGTEITRSTEDIQKRMSELRALMELNNIYLNVGTYHHPVMRQPRRYELLKAELNELRWFLGEDISITDGVG